METIHSLPISQPHRDVDHYIFEHSHNIDTLIIAPPTIYGLGTGPFKRHSYKIPEIIRSGVKYGQVATLGKGVNMWNCVHVEDLADFYILALEKALEGKADIRKEGWYFVEDGQYVFRDLVQKISEVILERKLIKTPEILHWTPKYVEELYGAYYARAMGSNSLCKGERSRALGWIPKKGNIFSSIEEEVDALIADNLL